MRDKIVYNIQTIFNNQLQYIVLAKCQFTLIRWRTALTECHWVSWTRPTCSRVRDIVENPVYAGACAFGRSVMRTELRDGRKRAVQRKIPRP